MDENRGNKNKDRFSRRRFSKSPISIRNKIKELEDQIEKQQKNKESPKAYPSSPGILPTHKHNQTLHLFPQNYEPQRFGKISPKHEEKKMIGRLPEAKVESSKNHLLTYPADRHRRSH